MSCLNRQWPTIRKLRILKVCSRIRFHQSQAITISYSRGNGKVESAVKIAKNILKKSRKEDPYLALLAYRNTPQRVTTTPQHSVSCKKTHRYPYSTPSTHPTDSASKSCAWKHRRKKTKINGSV